MTQEKLVAQIEQDIKQKGGARVPMGIIQEVLSADTPVSIEIDATLEEFAGNHGWRFRHEDALPTARVMFCSDAGAGQFSEKGEK